MMNVTGVYTGITLSICLYVQIALSEQPKTVGVI